MIRFIMFIFVICLATMASANDLVGQQSYLGTINAVAPGFYGHTGVELVDGMSCRGRRQVILLTSNPRYSDILAILLTAQASHSSVKFYAIAAQPDLGGFCTIGEAALGNFSVWNA